MKTSFSFGTITAIGLILISLVALAVLGGCAQLTAQTKQSISQTKNDEAVKQAQAEAAAKLAAEKAKVDAALLAQKAAANPVKHPFAWASAAVKKLLKPLIAICIFFLVVWIAGWALSTTLPASLAGIGAKVGSRGFFASLALIFALPFFPWVFFGVSAAVLIWFIVELVIAKGNASAALSAIEADVDPLISREVPQLSPAAGSSPAAGVLGAITSAVDSILPPALKVPVA